MRPQADNTVGLVGVYLASLLGSQSARVSAYLCFTNTDVGMVCVCVCALAALPCQGSEGRGTGEYHTTRLASCTYLQAAITSLASRITHGYL